MKISTNNSTVATNNEDAVSYDFNIGDVGTIIEILRNRLYSNPVQTLTQEYLSNARDSHREANKANVPIKVTLPTKLDSCLKIRDFGIGLSKDRVADVFVKYGKSTKRSDNLQTGGFGLGAKSAWAYTDSFVVVSYYNGTCSTYVAHTGKSSNGTFELVSEVETNEPNGVEVQIPIKETDIQRFVSAVYRTTFFWEVRPELHGITDVEIPKEYASPNFKYEKNNLIIATANDFMESLFETKNYSNKSVVLIDKIPYGISKFHYQLENLRKMGNVVHNNNIVFIEVNNGDIEVAASREEVAKDEKNIERLEDVCQKAINNIWEIVREEFDVKFQDLTSYMTVYRDLRNTFTFNSIPKDLIKLEYTYDDVKFEMHGLNCFVKCDKFREISYYHEEEQENRTVIRCTNNEQSVRITEDDKLVIVDCEYGDIIKKRKAKKLLENGVDHVYFVTCDPSDVAKLQKGANALLLSQLKHDNVTYVAKKRAAGVVAIRILGIEHGRNGYRVENMEKKEIDLEFMEGQQDKKYVLVPNVEAEKYDYRNRNFVNMVTCMRNNGYEVIKTNKKDYDKVIDLNNVVEYDDFVKNIEEHLPLSDSQIDAVVFARINQTIHNLLAHAKDIECPKIKELFTLYPVTHNRARDVRVSEDILAKYRHHKTALEKFQKATKLEEEVMERYPLLNTYYSYHNVLKEYVYYINNKYQTVYKDKCQIVYKDQAK